MSEHPDLIVLGGDYVTWGDREYVAPAAEALAALSAPQGVFGILGNHDDDHDMPAALARNGVQVLKDARTRLTIRNETVDLVGIRFWTKRPIDIAALVRGAAPMTILLAHDPRRLTEAAALNVPLVLSGHTHGGQVVLPLVGAIAAQKFPVVAGPRPAREDDDVREPRRRNDLRAGADQLSAGGGGPDAAACLKPPKTACPASIQTAVHRGEPRVAQPHQVMHQRRRLIGRVGKAEVIPVLVEKALVECRSAQRLGLLPREGIPAIGRRVARRRMLRLDEIGDEQRAARRHPLGAAL